MALTFQINIKTNTLSIFEILVSDASVRKTVTERTISVPTLVDAFFPALSPS